MTWAQYRRGVAQCGTSEVHLSPKVIDLLLILMLRRGQWVSYPEMIEFIWPNPDLEPDWARRCICVYRHRLRHGLGCQKAIETNNRMGLRMALPEELVALPKISLAA